MYLDMLITPPLAVDYIVVIVVLLWLVYLVYRRIRANAVLPPGPVGYPIIGNVLDMMVNEIWVAAQEWGKRYGGLLYLRGFGQSIVIINSYEIAVDLLERRSLKYSDRPNSVMLNELQGWDWMFANLPYGDHWKRKRNPLQRFLESSNAAHHEQILKSEVQKLMRQLIHSPRDFYSDIRRSMASIIMMLTYGHEVLSLDDQFVDLADKCIDQLALALRPGAYLVDALPLLKYLPKWFPGAGFQMAAEKGKKLSHDMQYVPYVDARNKTLSGKAVRSFTSQRIEYCIGVNGELSRLDEETISSAAGVCYMAGVDTSTSMIQCFILAMTLFPEAQRRAQEEIDRVVGSDRLPQLSDRPQLPYCAALCKELLRWQPVSPLGLAHASKEDDEFDGYYIPAKSTIIANQWAMLRDPVEYPEPSAFRPERFLPSAGGRIQRDPSKIAFGFGRRVCPGKHFAESTMFLAVCQTLAVFSISKIKDEEGNIMEPVVEFALDGVVHHPSPFDCDIIPRSKEAASLIQWD
ncbi:cytochrome P450 [Schizopora paradoxa]|uniref:Cytochrome P450 n=1 Tax=Schizopora paradoxa TaxID=27342 RepID=A0A0H2RD56_9AGAM|nr:cytochrome P450 [Schizopora paradoxa]